MVVSTKRSDSLPVYSPDKAGGLSTTATAQPEPILPCVWYTRPSYEIGTPPPASWLYVSKRLDLEWLSNVPLWWAPVITFAGGDSDLSTTAPGVNSTAFYRISPAVVAWLEAAGLSLEATCISGQTDRGQLDAYLEAMAVVWRFTDQYLHPDTMRAVRGQPGIVLPEVPQLKREIVCGLHFTHGSDVETAAVR